MDIAEYYKKLPYDLSGSRSKNRFRVELLWGVSVMLDLMKENRDFTVVFDYVCDVEIHYKDGFEFHQVKTHGPNFSSYSSKALIRKKSENSAGSVLGKLYALNKDAADNVKLVIVSNVPLQIGKKKCDYGEFSLEDLPVADKNDIGCALKHELGITHVELSKVFYIHTHLNLRSPKYEILGKLLDRFLEVKHCQPRNTVALYRLIVETVRDRACNEYSQPDYESIVKVKGVSRAEFDQMLDVHADNERNGVQQANEYISKIEAISKKRRYRQALASLLEQMPKAAPLRALEAQIVAFLQSNELGAVSSVLPVLNQKFGDQFPIEYTQEEKELFFVITIGRFEMEGFDNGNDF